MKKARCSVGLKIAMTVFTTMLFVNGARATAYKQLYKFNANSTESGKDPYSSLISDSAGNLYGTTLFGGTYGEGVVFELVKPTGHGGWTQKILHSFENNSVDGYRPYASLVFDTSGDLYGTTVYGGTNGDGVVFELMPPAGTGKWTEQILHDFNDNGTDGFSPYGGLIIDEVGNLYGTTPFGGNSGGGTVFELTLASGIWTENILYSFKLKGEDGYEPFAGLTSDAEGNLYGTTVDGGILGGGTVFELNSAGENILYNFSTSGGGPYTPYAGVVFDNDGNLYGTTLNGGAGYGTVFELAAPTGGGGWTENTLHSFEDNGKDGTTPYAGVILDSGNLYGDTTRGGSNGKGVVFKLVSPTGEGTWPEKILHTFNANEKGTDGEDPQASLLLNGGNLYGTASLGGRLGGGTMFEIVP